MTQTRLVVYSSTCGFGVTTLNLRAIPRLPSGAPQPDILPDIPPGSPGDSLFQGSPAWLDVTQGWPGGTGTWSGLWPPPEISLPAAISHGWPTRLPWPRLHSGTRQDVGGGSTASLLPATLITHLSFVAHFGNLVGRVP